MSTPFEGNGQIAFMEPWTCDTVVTVSDYTICLYVYLSILIDFDPVVDDDWCFKYEVRICMLMAKWCSVGQFSHTSNKQSFEWANC